MLLALRWPLLVLYVLMLAAFLGIVSLAATFVGPEALWGLAVLLILLGCQAMFFVGRANPHSLQPAVRRHLLAPTITAALMTSVLLVGVGCALTERYRSSHPWSGLTLVFVLDLPVAFHQPVFRPFANPLNRVDVKWPDQPLDLRQAACPCCTLIECRAAQHVATTSATAATTIPR